MTFGTASAKDSIFCEAVDSFCGMIAKGDSRTKMTNLISISWDIVLNNQHNLNLYKPSIQITPTTLTVGRVTLPRMQQVQDKEILLIL
jgi:hypothetical protein